MARILSRTLLVFAGTVLIASRLAFGEAAFERLRPAEVNASLEENRAAWSAKIEATGRPRLLLTRPGLEALKARLLAEPRPAETKALLRQAASIAQRYPRPYAEPEPGFEKTQEPWIFDAGNDILTLAVACAVEPSPALEKTVHDAVVEACKYPTWGRPGACPEANMDMACASMARAVALAWDWFPDLWTPDDSQLILATISERAGQLLAGLYGKAYWSNRYADNHNHVDCAGLAWCGLAFYNDIPQAPEWLAATRLDYQRVAEAYPHDGSSPEGVSYWAFGMHFILQYIEGTRTVIDSANLYDAPFLKNTATYRLNASSPGFGGILPWADSEPRDGQGPQHLLRRLAAEHGDAAAAWLARQLPWPARGSADVVAWMALWNPRVEGQPPSMSPDYHSWETDWATTRSGWGSGDYLLAIKSGFNNRNHCHLDAGALAFAFGNEWLLTAPGYGKGRGLREFWDFGGARWTFFANATESHCTLLIDGENQRFDPEARGTIDAFLSAPLWCWTGIDLTQAYREVRSVRREILHRRGDYILVFDAVAPKAPATVEWLAQLPDEPKKEGNTLVLEADAGQLRLDMLSPAGAFAPRQPTSLHVDKSNIHTYALKQSGEKMSFTALLQPGFSLEAGPGLQTACEKSAAGVEHVTIRGAEWADEIFHGETVAALKTKTGASAQAKTLAVRAEKEKATSLLATGASRVELDGVAIQPEAPAVIGLQRMPDGSWIVDSDQDLGGKITAAKYEVQAFEVTGATGKPYRYLLAKGGMTCSRAAEWLKSLQAFRSAPYKQVPVKPLALQAPLSASAVIPIEAEDFISQKRGLAEVVEGKPGAVGNSVRNFGYGAPDHLISWEINVPRAGQYQLTIRYTTELTDLKLGVLVDGAAPLPELLKIALPDTGGWSIKESNWKNLVLSDAKGQPLILNLSQGKHRLSLVNPTGAVGLDRLELRGAGKP